MPPPRPPSNPPRSPRPKPPDIDRRAYARAVRRLIVLLVAVGIASRVVRLFIAIAVWGDEAMLAMNFLTRDYAGLTRALDDAQVAPILFMWAEKFMIDSFGMSEKIIRLLPLVAGIAGLVAFWDFARRAVPPTAAVLAVGLVAVSVAPVTMSTNLKPYSGDLCWSAVLMALAVRWHNRPARLWPLAALAAVVPLAIGMSYPVVFVAGGVGIYLLPLAWRGGWRARAYLRRLRRVPAGFVRDGVPARRSGAGRSRGGEHRGVHVLLLAAGVPTRFAGRGAPLAPRPPHEPRIRVPHRG